VAFEKSLEFPQHVSVWGALKGGGGFVNKTLWLGLALVGLGCSVGEQLEVPVRPVERLPAKSLPGRPITGTTVGLGPAQSWWPLELVNPVEVEAGPDERSFNLPMARSVRGVLAKVTSPTPVILLVDGSRVEVFQNTVVFLPARDGKAFVQLAQPTPVRLSISPLLRLDTIGGGFVAETEPAERVELATTVRRLTVPPMATADDTMLRLVTVSVTGDAMVRIGRCQEDQQVADAQTFGPTSASNVWLPAGELCLSASSPATVTLTTVGRVRRFATTTLRPLTPPSTVLDTRTGIAWDGRPSAGQVLEVALPRIGATHLLLSLTAGSATASVRSCTDSTAPSEFTPGLWLVSTAQERVCVYTSGTEHLSLTVVGAVMPLDETPPVCTATRAPFECTAARDDILGQLRCVPGVVTAEPHQGRNRRVGVTQFAVAFEQPADHTRPDKGTFLQHLIVSVRSFEAPVVLHTTGYDLRDYSSDVSRVFPTNEIEVEHRFFSESVPKPLDLSVLTIMQSAADSHRIVEAFSRLFKQRWVSTGHSKGGMTALFHRRFFPCDVEATAPYVTPISLGRDDERYGPHLATIGGTTWASCREAFFSVDREVIRDVQRLALRLPGTYSRIGGAENALWATTGMGYWNIFQTGQMNDPQNGCRAVEASVATQLPRWVERQAAGATSYSDQVASPMMGNDLMYPFQTLNELGSPGATRAHLTSFGPVPTLKAYGEFTVPLAMHPRFEPRAMPDVLSWLARSGERFQFVYGGWDPWTGGAVGTPGVTDAAKYIVPRGSHGISVLDLSGTQRIEAMGRLERWLKVAPLVSSGNFAPEQVRTYADVMHEYPL
jgi:hypothetical protein